MLSSGCLSLGRSGRREARGAASAGREKKKIQCLGRMPDLVSSLQGLSGRSNNLLFQLPSFSHPLPLTPALPLPLAHGDDFWH